MFEMVHGYEVNPTKKQTRKGWSIQPQYPPFVGRFMERDPTW